MPNNYWFSYPDVFLEACLSSPNVKLIQTNFEADPYLAKLATVLNCPILSNDSDFFIYQVQFIKLDSLDWDVSEDEEQNKFLDCQIFKKSKFMNYYGIKDSTMLHLMSSVIGNDYIPPKTFERFFNQMRQPKKRKSLSPRHRIMMGLLEWLGRENDCDKG